MRAPVLLLATLLTACQSLSGLTGATKFACKAPDGIACSSVSGVYATVQARHGAPARDHRLTPPTPLPATVPGPGEPLRSAPRLLRIWMAPWVDDDGTLHDQAFLYVQVDPGQWRLGEIRRSAARPAPQADVAATTQQTVAAPLRGNPAIPRPATPTAPPRSPAASARPLADVRHDQAAQAAARAVAQPAAPSGEQP